MPNIHPLLQDGKKQVILTTIAWLWSIKGLEIWGWIAGSSIGGQQRQPGVMLIRKWKILCIQEQIMCVTFVFGMLWWYTSNAFIMKNLLHHSNCIKNLRNALRPNHPALLRRPNEDIFCLCLDSKQRSVNCVLIFARMIWMSRELFKDCKRVWSDCSGGCSAAKIATQLLQTQILVPWPWLNLIIPLAAVCVSSQGFLTTFYACHCLMPFETATEKGWICILTVAWM